MTSESLICYNFIVIDRDKVINRIVQDLMQVEPFKIVLFGSMAEGTFGDESDVDILVILDNNDISTDFHSRMEKKLIVRKAILNISREIPIDLLVYTKAEFSIIQKNPNCFFKEIQQMGKILYEKAS